MRLRPLLPMMLAVPLALVALAGCSTGSTDTGGSPGIVSPSGAATSTPAPAPTASDPADPNAPAGQCADTALKAAVTPDAGGGAAGSQHYAVVFTNTGTSPCELRGYPGVSVVGGGNGTQIGVPADRPTKAAAIATVTLQAGGTASAALTATDIAGGGPLPDCDAVPGDGWRIYPPHSFTAVFVADSGVLGCDGTDAPTWLHLTGPVVAG